MLLAVQPTAGQNNTRKTSLGGAASDLSEKADIIAANDPGDFVRFETLGQHLLYDRIQESTLLVRPDVVGARNGPSNTKC